MEKLAIHGGTPVRTKPLPPNYPGAILMGKEELEAVSKVIMNQSPFRYYGQNMVYAVRQLEEQMAQDLSVPYVLGVTSCTAGLIVAMKAAGIGYGDKVIVPANTFIATPGAVVSAGAVPVFAEVDESLNLDPLLLESVMDEDVKAIIAVHVSGSVCDMDAIMAFAEKHNLYVIEDVAQSCGIKYKGKCAGTIGHIGVFSFQMNKMLTAGEGGAVVTRDVKLFERAARYHDQGMFRDRKRYGVETDENEDSFAGQNYRMSELTGAVMVEQWKKLDFICSSTRSHYKKVRTALEELVPELVYRKSNDRAGDLGSNLGLRFETREQARAFTEAMNAELIAARMMYNGKLVFMSPQIMNQRTPETKMSPYQYPFKHPVVYSEDMCPNSDENINLTVLIPLSPILNDDDLRDVITGVAKVYKGLFSTVS